MEILYATTKAELKKKVYSGLQSSDGIRFHPIVP